MRKLVPFLAVSMLVSASASPTIAADTSDRSPFFVDTTTILLMESFPVQASLHVTGAVPTPCHTADWAVDQDADGIVVTLWSEADPEAICPQVLEEVEVSIALGSFEAADLPVSLNGEPVGRLEIGSGPLPAAPALVGAGWSFGFCAGYCRADLVIDGPALELTGSGNQSEGTLYTNRGSLTAAGVDAVAAAVAALSGVELEPVYGCPDCADGGAAYVTISADGATSRHDMEFGNPPEVLAEIHELAMSIIGALETCTSGELVEVAEDCSPQER